MPTAEAYLLSLKYSTEVSKYYREARAPKYIKKMSINMQFAGYEL